MKWLIRLILAAYLDPQRSFSRAVTIIHRILMVTQLPSSTFYSCSPAAWTMGGCMLSLEHRVSKLSATNVQA